ncbi:MAG: hypothetical protein ABI580_00280 [Burkholderiaceae bacterium]
MKPIESGELIYAITTAVLASFIVTWVLLTGYRRAVTRTMRTASAEADLESSIASPMTPSEAPSAPSVRSAIGASATRQRLALVYGAAFGLSALVLSLPFTWEIVRESGAGSWPGLLANWMALWAPSVVLVGALLAASRRSTLTALVVAWLLVVLAATALPALVRLIGGNYSMAGLAANAWQASGLFLLNAIPPLALIYITGRRRVRNVLPLILVVVILLSLLLLGYNRWQMANVQDIATANPVLIWLVTNIGAFAGPALLFLLLSLPVGLLAWWLLLRLERRYQQHAFSNMQLVVDSWWALIVADNFVSLWRYGAATAIFVSATAFAIYWITVRVGLRASGLGARAGGPTMLLLRVFGFQDRTERLFDRVAERWRFEGPVAMIAGADLALRSVDVDEALAFVRGEIESRYVSGAANLASRLQALDAGVDPDGRFRVGEFFCFDNTWRPALRSLVERARVVLMDLRGFTKANAGCIFELEQLSALGAAGRCVFVVDSTTDRTLVETSLGLASEASGQPAWITMKREAAAMPALWRELAQRAGVASAAA